MLVPLKNLLLLLKPRFDLCRHNNAATTRMMMQPTARDMMTMMMVCLPVDASETGGVLTAGK